MLHKIVVAGLCFFIMYWMTGLAILGAASWDLPLTLPVFAILLLVGALREGYLSRGWLQK
jgi:hypothetical protein